MSFYPTEVCRFMKVFGTNKDLKSLGAMSKLFYYLVVMAIVEQQHLLGRVLALKFIYIPLKSNFEELKL